MHPLRSRLSRLLPLIHPSRPPSSAQAPLRLFASKSPRLSAIARPSARPQLPFLAGSRSRPTYRLLSTEQKANIKYGIKLGAYWTIMGWTIIFGGMVSFWFLRQDWLDRLYPSPSDWRFLSKWYWRDAKHELETDGQGRGMLDWSKIGTYYRNVVALLEQDFGGFMHRPTGLILQNTVVDDSLPFANDAELHTPPPMFTPAELDRGEPMWKGRIGYDITMKSEAWIRGYFEAMMGLAKATEMREGYMTYKKDGSAYAPQHIRSEDNPYPTPLPPLANKECPDISECYPVFEPPSFHYKRILTTKGLTSRQRMDAGLAYASYLDHSGAHGDAEAMYRWSFDLALQGLPASTSANSVVDRKTGLIKPDAPIVTSNIITCSTALARHLAEQDRIKEALAVYLSVLRARRNAPSAPSGRQYPPRRQDYSLKNVDSIIQWLTSLPFTPDFPPAPSNGEERFERKRSEECEEAALSLYVAEILFAKMGRRREGLAWTKDATEAAEKRMSDKLLDKKGVKVCEQCVHEGLKNWKDMLGTLATEQGSTLDRSSLRGPSTEESRPQAQPKSESWFWRGLYSVTGTGADQALLQEQDWAKEEYDISKRLAQFEENQLNARLSAVIAGNSSWFVV